MTTDAVCAIAIMAKAPAAGRSKTRLCPPFSPQEAAEASAAFLQDMAVCVEAAGRLQPIDLWVAYAPAAGEAAMRALLPSARLVLADGAGVAAPRVEAFGRTLLQTTMFLLDRGYRAACVLNSDSPSLKPAYLAEAAAFLTAPERVAMGPAEDGGYYLLGMCAAHAGLFADIAWSTDSVAAATRARAAALGLDLHELPAWYDVDDARSLSRLCRAIDDGSEQAPCSEAWLARLDARARLAAHA